MRIRPQRGLHALRALVAWFLAGGVLGATAIGSAQPLPAEQAALEAPDATEHAVAPTLSRPAQEIVPLLSLRHAAPPCAAIAEHFAEQPEQALWALLEVAEEVDHPPQAAIHAATCLIELGGAGPFEATLSRWVSERSSLGVGLVVLDHLDELEPGLARRLAQAALAGELAARARTRLMYTSHQEVRALLGD